MDPKSLSSIAEVVRGKLHGESNLEVTAVCTDSRRVLPGELFVALRGPNHDGHNFLAEAAQAGAAGALVESLAIELRAFPQIVVSDSVAALQQLSRSARKALPTRFVGITGSNGKTSTKEMLAAILGEKFRVLKTEGNLNNHLGVPLSLLRANRCHKFAVIELGMNQPGEIAALTALIEPDFGLITNVGVAHIEFLGSKKAIANEKAALAERVPPQGVVVLNANDEFTPAIAARCRARVVQAGLGRGDLRATDLVHRASGESFTLRGPDFVFKVELPVVGQHMVENAVLAAAMGHALNLSPEQIAAGLHKTVIPGGRLKLQKLGRITLINDSYNANPDSMIAALRTAAELPIAGRRIAVLGRMAELGREGVAGHRRVGAAVADLGFQFLVTIGKEASLIAEAARERGLKDALAAPDQAGGVAVLSDLLQAGDVVLVKGSFSARMDRVIAGLEAAEKQAKWIAP